MKILPRSLRMAASLGLAVCLHAQTPHIAYTLEGKGPAIVFVHGLGGRNGVWKDVAQRLKKDHTVLCVDLPGHGQSGKPPLDEGGAVDIPATGQAIAALVKELKPGPAIVVGHSIGGPVAMEAVLAEPSLFRGLVLVDSFLAGIPGAWIDQTAAAMKKDKVASLKGFLLPMALGSKQGDQLVQEAMAVDTEVFVAYLRSVTTLRTFGRAADLEIPALAIQTGPLAPGKDEKADLASRGMQDVPKLKPVRFPRSRHWPMWDERDAFLKAITDFEASLAKP